MGAAGTQIAGAVWLWAVLAGVLATLSGAFLGEGAYQVMRRRRLAASMLAPTAKEQVLLKLKGGVRPLRRPAARLMSAFPVLEDSVDDMAMLLQEQSVDFTREALLSDLLALSLAAVAIGWLAGGSPTFGVAVGCIVLVGVLAYARNLSERKNASMREAIPEALRNLSMSFRSGSSLPQTLADSAKEADGYLGHLFSVASDRLEMGASPTEALSVMKGNPRVPELSFVAVALDVQHQSGGSIAPVLESAMDSVESELRLMRSLKVQTAQAKLSASIVTVMPFVLVALFSLMSPDFLSPFFESVLGMAVLAVALVMQLAGVLMVRRMLKMDTR